MLLAATPAHAISFNFQFRDVSSPSPTNQLVTGTLSGLVEGSNFGLGITATVTSSPNGSGVGSGYNFLFTGNGGDAFTVTGGNISFANVLFDNGTSYLGLGTVGNGITGYQTGLSDQATYEFSNSNNTTTQFTPATPVPFKSDSGVISAVSVFCFGAAILLRRHLAKKRMISVEA